MSYSHMGTPTLPLAMLHFTAEFEMGSGGAIALLSPENWLLRADYSALRLTFGNMNHQSFDCKLWVLIVCIKNRYLIEILINIYELDV